MVHDGNDVKHVSAMLFSKKGVVAVHAGERNASAFVPLPRPSMAEYIAVTHSRQNGSTKHAYLRSCVFVCACERCV
jgi:hypothetical protein